MESAGLLAHVFNPDPSAAFTAASYPTLGAMRAAGKTVLVASSGSLGWGPGVAGSYADAHDVEGADHTCADARGASVTCVEGWDAVTASLLDPSRAVLPAAMEAAAEAYGATTNGNNAVVFAIENLSSRRGRSDTSLSMWPQV